MKLVIQMSNQSPVCEICTSWMLEKDGWLKCIGCGYQKKITKRIVKPVGKDAMENQTLMPLDLMHIEVL